MEVSNNENLKLELIYPTALSAASIAFSQHVEIEGLEGNIEPMLLIIIVLAGSGVGKSLAGEKLFAAIHTFLDEMRELQKELEKEYQLDLELWELEKKNILKSIDWKDKESVKSELMIHELSKPTPPYDWDMILEDITPLGAIDKAQGKKTLAIASAEGVNFYHKRTIDAIEKFCAAWSNETLKVTRKTYSMEVGTETHIHIYTPVQPKSFHSLLESMGDKLRSSGFFARAIVSNVGEAEGNRQIQHGHVKQYNYLNEFNQKIYNSMCFLKEKIDSGDNTKKRLYFSPEAQGRLIDLHNEIEYHTNMYTPNGRFHGCEDHAKRIVQNTIRICGALHCINEPWEVHEISIFTLEEAINLMAYFSDTYRNLFVKPPQALLDAEVLNNWLDIYRGKNSGFIPKNFILQNGPNSLRNKDRLNNALTILSQNNYASVFTEGKKTWLNLCPLVQTDILPGHLSETKTTTFIQPQI